MGLRLAFRTNLAAFGAMMLLALLGPVASVERANAAVQAYPMKWVLSGILGAFFLSMLWLYLQSWVMLVRGWKRRVGKENAKLCLILFLFSFFAAYYFYLKRYDIDSNAE